MGLKALTLWNLNEVAQRRSMQEALLLAEAKTLAVLNRTIYVPPPVVEDIPTVVADLAKQIRNNPLINMEWLSVEEQASLNDSLEVVDVSQKSSQEARGEGDPFVPSLPARHIEWEVSKVDACMWRIPNISTLAPISREIWRAWGTISDDEVEVCCQNALKGVTFFETNPPYLTKWPIKIFGAPKYKCTFAAGAKGRLIMLMGFLNGEARKMVLDHIAFLFLRQWTLDATMEQVHNVDGRLLTQMGDAPAIHMIEAMIKPGKESDSNDANKRQLDLNNTPTEPARKKGMYANQTRGTGRGRGAYFREAASPGQSSGHHQRPPHSGPRSAVGHGTPVLGVSPLQKRNIDFTG
ncbi:unnamed protein product [Calypogeia fissa]